MTRFLNKVLASLSVHCISVDRVLALKYKARVLVTFRICAPKKALASTPDGSSQPVVKIDPSLSRYRFNPGSSSQFGLRCRNAFQEFHESLR